MKINWFEKINYYYNKRMYTGERLWSIDRVKKAVECNKRNPEVGITKEQFKEITGQDYIE